MNSVHAQFGFVDACYSAVISLAFVSPSSVLPRIIEQLQEDLNPKVINSISDDDLAIWATPEGTTYVDGQFQLASISYL